MRGGAASGDTRPQARPWGSVAGCAVLRQAGKGTGSARALLPKCSPVSSALKDTTVHLIKKKKKIKKSCSLLPILASQGWRQSLPQCLRSCQLCEPGHCLLYVMPKFILWICHLSSSSSDGLGAAVRVSEVPVQLPWAAPAAAPLLTRALAAGAARLSGHQLLGN